MVTTIAAYRENLNERLRACVARRYRVPLESVHLVGWQPSPAGDVPVWRLPARVSRQAERDGLRLEGRAEAGLQVVR